MKTMRLPVLTALLILVTACVTINVYFPAAAAQEAADKIINRVYGTEGEAGKPAAEPSLQPKSQLDNTIVIAMAGALDWLIAPTEAAALDIDIKSAAIQSITAAMEARHPNLAPNYASGAIGMTSDGQIIARDLNSIPLRDRSKVQQLIADENKDRTALYAEIARANGHPEWGDEIRATFARRWIANAPTGWWYQDAAGGWKQK